MRWGATHVLLDPFTEMIHFIIVRDNASEMHACRVGVTERDLDFFWSGFFRLNADAGHDLNANRDAWTTSRGCVVVIRFCCCWVIVGWVGGMRDTREWKKSWGEAVSDGKANITESV